MSSENNAIKNDIRTESIEFEGRSSHSGEEIIRGEAILNYGQEINGNRTLLPFTVLCHGLCGDMNGHFFPLLAKELAVKCKCSTFRFNFPLYYSNADGSGQSPIFRYGDYKEDVEDLKWVIEALERRFPESSVATVLGHSRGGNVVLMYGAKYGASTRLSNVINVSGRFEMKRGFFSRHSPSELEELKSNQDKFFNWKTKVRGRKEQLLIPKEQIDLYMSIDMKAVCQQLVKDQALRILTVHGVADSTIPFEDSISFANSLGDLHHLALVPEADHYYRVAGGTSNDSRVPQLIDNIVNWLNDNSRNNLSFIKLPRDVEIPNGGVLTNLRDFGGYASLNGSRMPAKIFYRCGCPSPPNKHDFEVIQNKLGIKLVIDLRSASERQKLGILQDEQGAICNIWCPSFQPETEGSGASGSGTKGKLIDRLQLYSRGPEGFAQAYMDLFPDPPSSKAYFCVLAQALIQHFDGSPILIHCSLGKDRTGVAVAMLQWLAQVPFSIILDDYALSDSCYTTSTTSESNQIPSSLKKLAKAMTNSTSSGTDQSSSPITLNYGNVFRAQRDSIRLFLDAFKARFKSPANYLLQSGAIDQAQLKTLIRDILQADRSANIKQKL